MGLAEARQHLDAARQRLAILTQQAESQPAEPPADVFSEEARRLLHDLQAAADALEALASPGPAPADGPGPERLVGEPLARQQHENEYQMDLPNGKVLWIAVRERPYFGADGAPMHVAGTADLRQALQGEVHLSDHILSQLIQVLAEPKMPPATETHFTDREQEILHLIGKGYRPNQIAERLGVSVRTINSHRQNLKRKLKLNSTAALDRFAIEWVHGKKNPAS